MTLIPYEEFQINESVLNRLKEAYADRKINEYFTQHRQFPDAETISSYHTLPEDLMEKYKMFFYTRYYHDEYHFEEEYGSGEDIEVSFDFSANEDSGSTILGNTQPLRFGASISGNDEEYQYDYWNIAVLINSGDYIGGYHPNNDMIGSFTSLKDATITLNSLKKYTICIYHRKSNYLYNTIIPSLPIDNQFHLFPKHVQNMEMSNYYGYETQMEDKEYMGIVKEYVPQKGGTISGSVYTLNPRMVVNISGLTNGLSCELGFGNKTVNITHGQDGNISTNGDSNRLTRLSETSVQYSAIKDEIVGKLSLNFQYLSSSRMWQNNIPYEMLWEFYVNGYNANGDEIEDLRYMDFINQVHLQRNNIGHCDIVIPPQGEDIDTGFEFNTIDD